ncbi:MAG: pyridoxal 5'-phosphate synthase [Panacagrimonas sp.]
MTGLIEEARNRGDHEASSAALATASADARPSVRTVEIMRVAPSWLILFANTETGKGLQMQINPRAGLCFRWPALSYQAIVEGAVVLLSETESDVHWSKMPRESSLGHWASDQTRTGAEAEELQHSLHELRHHFNWQSVPRVPAWRAFEVRPDRIDFWPTGWQRLRTRERYLKSLDGSWTVSKDNP